MVLNITQRVACIRNHSHSHKARDPEFSIDVRFSSEQAPDCSHISVECGLHELFRTTRTHA